MTKFSPSLFIYFALSHVFSFTVSFFISFAACFYFDLTLGQVFWFSFVFFGMSFWLSGIFRKLFLSAISGAISAYGVFFLVMIFTPEFTYFLLPSKLITVRDQKSIAFAQCKTFVKAQMKTPSTAKFPLLDFTSRRTGNYIYTIDSYVDGQNPFGANLRVNYTCTVKWNGIRNSDSWTLIRFEFEDM